MGKEESTKQFLADTREKIEREFELLEQDFPKLVKPVRAWLEEWRRAGDKRVSPERAEQESTEISDGVEPEEVERSDRPEPEKAECSYSAEAKEEDRSDRAEIEKVECSDSAEVKEEERSDRAEPEKAERLDSAESGREFELALKYLYTASPLSDLANYPVETFAEFARHGVLLWRECAQVRTLPEELYLNYVLHHRVNEEEIRPCRALFWSELRKRVAGKSAREAAIEVNYWCAEHVTYQSGDDRTLSALAVYQRGYGRCGEESVFLVNALRSVGIPARQVYAPRWSHCDDNHAWVELWCDGGWHFTGACEPLMVLDQGWFTGAASRAMLVHSRVFPMYTERAVDARKKAATGEIGCREDAAVVYNHLARYADTCEVVIHVRDASGAAVRGAQVAFQVLNYAEYSTIARVVTDESGAATFLTGLGTLRVQVNWKEDIRIFDLDARKEQSREIRFGAETDLSMYSIKTERDEGQRGNTVRVAEESPDDERPEMSTAQNMRKLPEDKLQEACRLAQEFAVQSSAASNEDGWDAVDVAAPAATSDHRTMPDRQMVPDRQMMADCRTMPNRQTMSDEERKREGDRRLAQANAIRRREKEGWENPELRRFLEGGTVQRQSEGLQCAEADGAVGGNGVQDSEIASGAVRRSVQDAAALQAVRRQLVDCLSEKDRTDCSCAVLEEHLACALPYREQWSPELFVPYVLNPRISHEILRCYRRGILDSFSEEEKWAFREDPGRIWERIRRTVRDYPEHERETVMTTPCECLRFGTGSPRSQRILFVAIARTLGIPSRLNPEDGAPEYWNGTRFAPADANQERSAQLKLTGGDGTKWLYFQNWSLARLQDGKFVSLDLRAHEWERESVEMNSEWQSESAEDDPSHTLRISLQPGIYRLITANRLPNGNYFTFEKTFELEAREVRTECLRLREARLEDMLASVELPEFEVTDAAGAAVSSRQLTSGGRRVLMWLCPGQEPTEHILNELLAQEEAFRAYADRITLLLDRDERSEKRSGPERSLSPMENPTLQTVLRHLPGVSLCRDSFAEHTELLSRSMYVDPTQLPLILVTDGMQNGIYAVSGYNVGTGELLLRILREHGSECCT